MLLISVNRATMLLYGESWKGERFRSMVEKDCMTRSTRAFPQRKSKRFLPHMTPPNQHNISIRTTTPITQFASNAAVR